MLDINGYRIRIGCISINPLGDPDLVFVHGFMDENDVIIETYNGEFYQVHQSHIEVVREIKINKLMK